MRDLVPAFFVFLYNPVSFVTKRNRVAPERKVSYTPAVAPATAVPFLGDKTHH